MARSGALFAVCFFAGLLGGLCSSLVLWLAGSWGLTTSVGVHITPDLNSAWLYPRLIWGGLWGLVYFLFVGSRRSRRHWIRKGIIVSLLPTAVQLFLVYPYSTDHGVLGFGLGDLTPLVELIFNGVWGFTTGLFTRLLWGRG